VSQKTRGIESRSPGRPKRSRPYGGAGASMEREALAVFFNYMELEESNHPGNKDADSV